MNQKVYEQVRKNPKFKELVTKRSSFAWKLAFTIFAIYYSFILTIAFIPEVLGKPIGDGVTSIGIPIGVIIILICFALTGLYTKRANNEFDNLINEIKDDIRFES